ncbi:hypothetical protein CROQUDRAFT_670378 [Cronartium quercuum f. sp. fusiforme G11]|uniref:Uncharacterized protein n=1 Tax=Cronartium quercuum f. sp. fusiforme G11 TaxID=708437 RepID=A0A9P6NIK1_9BASI|nr:hypothetical protein CROQUDRAFT_670378 [Cronartium quercuum f. sp. fusiforme G11]
MVEQTLVKLNNLSDESFHCCGRPEELMEEYATELEVERLLSGDGANRTVTTTEEETIGPQPRRSVPAPDFYQVPGPWVPPTIRARNTVAANKTPDSMILISSDRKATSDPVDYAAFLCRTLVESKEYGNNEGCAPSIISPYVFPVSNFSLNILPAF